MLQRFWRWIKRFFQRLWGTPPQTSTPAETVSKPVLTDTEYENIFLQLLERVDEGASRGQIKGFLIGRNITDAELVAWLRRFGEKLLGTPEQHQEIAQRMVRLSDVCGGELGKVAGEFGRQILAVIAPSPGSENVNKNDVWDEVIEAEFVGEEGKRRDAENAEENLEVGEDAEMWLERGNQQFDEGDFLGAVACYDKALAIKPDYHQAWYNRGVALRNLGKSEEAIASYDRALAIKPDYHQAWYNRGVALRNLGKSEEAIASYDRALAIKPDYHQAWYNRGVALRNLGKSEEAIASYDRALAIKPDKDEAWNNRGVALRNLGKSEEEIACYDRALAIKPDDHQAWYNRGIAAGSSPNYNSQAAVLLQMQFPKSPPVIANFTLTRRGYEGQLLSYQEGLKHCPKETHPQGWGKLHHAIGQAHYRQGRYNSHQSYWNKAVTSYHQALETLTQEAFPELHLEVLQDLIKALLGLGETDKAKELQRRATDLLHRLLNNSPSEGGLGGSEYQKKQLALKFYYFRQLTVDIAIQSGDFITAWETAEGGKNACLTWLLYAWSDEIYSPKYADIQQLLHPTTAIVYWHISPVALHTFIIKHGEAEPIVLEIGNLTPQPPSLAGKGEEELPPSPRRRGDGGEVDHQELPPSPRRRGDGGEVDHQELPPSPRRRGVGGEVHPFLKRLTNFENWVKDWNQQYQEYRKRKKQEAESNVTWDNLPTMLSQLQEILDISTIEANLTDITDLILIPHQDLHRFPIHSLFSDRYTISYLPSAQIGLNLRTEVLTTNEGNLLIVEDPESENFEPMLFAEIESGVLRHIFTNHNHLTGANVTRSQLETELQKPHQIFHFTGHGFYNFRNPSQSALALSGDEKFTLNDIVKLSFSGYQIISLSACETAVTGNETITTEFVGLVSAFLRQGASYVLSTLWIVDEISSALIIIRFYQFLTAGATPPVALKQAQNWLRTVTYPQLAKWYEELATEEMQASNYGCWQQLKSKARTSLKKSVKIDESNPPFHHPYYWAGFTITGLLNS